MEYLPEDFDGDLVKYKLPIDDLYFIKKNYKNLLLILAKNSLEDLSQIVTTKKDMEALFDLQERMNHLLCETFPTLKHVVNKSLLQIVKENKEEIGKSTLYTFTFSFYSFQLSTSLHYYDDDDNSLYDCWIAINDEAFYQMGKDFIDFAVTKRKAYINKINSIAFVLGLKQNKDIVLLNKFLLHLAFDPFPGINPLYDFAEFYNLNLFC